MFSCFQIISLAKLSKCFPKGIRYLLSSLHTMKRKKHPFLKLSQNINNGKTCPCSPLPSGHSGGWKCCSREQAPGCTCPVLKMLCAKVNSKSFQRRREEKPKHQQHLLSHNLHAPPGPDEFRFPSLSTGIDYDGIYRTERPHTL